MREANSEIGTATAGGNHQQMMGVRVSMERAGGDAGENFDLRNEAINLDLFLFHKQHGINSHLICFYR